MYVAMAGAGLIVELLFRAIGLVPATRHALVLEAHITFNYTTVLNLVFLVVAAVLIARLLRTRGNEMLRMMNRPS